jgi:hypothetical protein
MFRTRKSNRLLAVALFACVSGCGDSGNTEAADAQVEAEPRDARAVPPDMEPEFASVDADATIRPELTALDQADDVRHEGGEQPEAGRVLLSVVIRWPEPETWIADPAGITLTAEISAERLEFVAVEVRSSLQGVLSSSLDQTTGVVSAPLAGLESGRHLLTVSARLAPDHEASDAINLEVACGFSTDFSLDLDPEEWRVMGTAQRHSGGWLEMTNHQTQVAGAVFYTGQLVRPGDLDARFRISTGACETIGTCSGLEVSDGFAMTFWNISTEQIDTLWEALPAGTGAGLSQEALDRLGMARPQAFTVEFDTYPNRCPPNGFWDPVQEAHVEINFDGYFYMASPELSPEERCAIDEPGADIPDYWEAVPSLVDNQWHDVHVIIDGTHIEVVLDELTVVDADVPDFEFKGGVLAFSGGSGAVPSYQRFDDLSFSHACE